MKLSFRVSLPVRVALPPSAARFIPSADAVRNVAGGAFCFLALALLALTLPFSALRYHRARYYEGTRRYPAALREYEGFLSKAPEGPRAAEVHVRAGELYAHKYQRCVEARRHFEAAGRLTAAEPWAGRARAGLMDCPDYFPLDSGRTWVYGDSQSGGKFMHLEWELRQSTILASLFAGGRKLKSDKVEYAKKDWLVLENGAPILRYPYRVGASWQARRGSDRLRYRIEAVGETVTTKAGTFEDCIKVREVNVKLPRSFKYDYYAPFVGRVKTTVGGPGFENPNTELLRFSTGA